MLTEVQQRRMPNAQHRTITHDFTASFTFLNSQEGAAGPKKPERSMQNAEPQRWLAIQSTSLFRERAIADAARISRTGVQP